MQTQTIEAKYESDMARLDAEYRALGQLRAKLPRWTLLALMAPLLGYYVGWAAGVVGLLVGGALTAVHAYLIAVRLGENRRTRELLERELSEQSRGGPDFGRSVWRSLRLSA